MTDDTTNAPCCEGCGLIVPREFRVAVMDERNMNPRIKVVDREWGSCAIGSEGCRWLCVSCIEQKN